MGIENSRNNAYSGVIVSAVIPAYNSGHFIAQAIESILAQTFEVSEIIVVDDGSADNTAQVAATFPKTRVIRRPNGGQGAARNTGIDAASGEWIGFLDHDDIWHPRKTEVQLQCASPEVGVIHANPFDQITFGTLWQRRAHITPSGALVRKQVLSDVDGFDESRDILGVEDLNLWLRIALAGWQFAQAGVGLFSWRTMYGNQSADDLKMANAELANIDKIGSLAKRPNSDIETAKANVRLEYARNLIAADRMQEARQLLDACDRSIAKQWLQLAANRRLKRLARKDVVTWLRSLQPREPVHGRSGPGRGAVRS